MNTLQQRIINKALEHSEHLTDWEYDFVYSLSDRPGTYQLSEKQNSILNRIWEKLDKAGVS